MNVLEIARLRFPTNSKRIMAESLAPQTERIESVDVLETGNDNSRSRSAIKIAQVISRLCIGGASVAVIQLTEALTRRGYSTLLLAGSVSNHEANMEDMALRLGVRPIRVRSLSRRTSWWNDLKAVWQLTRLFRRERPAIVHTHTAKAGAIGRIAARLAGVPVCVHTFHGHVFHGHFSSVKSHFYLAIERFLARWTDALVVVSESQGQELIAKYRVALPVKFVTIPVGLDMDRFLNPRGRRGEFRKLVGCRVGQPLIGWVGRMTPVKNPELFLEAAASIHAVDPTAKFVMVGDGELRSTLERLLADRNLADAVTILGWQSDLSGFYRDLDVLVMTSRQEGTPLVLLEAMASGKPFVATKVGGIRDLVTGSGRALGGWQLFENGILTDSSPSNLTAAIRYVLEQPEQAHKMGCAGRAFASSAFSSRRTADDLERLYLKLLIRNVVS